MFKWNSYYAIGTHGPYSYFSYHPNISSLRLTVTFLSGDTVATTILVFLPQSKATDSPPDGNTPQLGLSCFPLNPGSKAQSDPQNRPVSTTPVRSLQLRGGPPSGVPVC